VSAFANGSGRSSSDDLLGGIAERIVVVRSFLLLDELAPEVFFGRERVVCPAK
jgi:hypothetical protein